MKTTNHTTGARVRERGQETKATAMQARVRASARVQNRRLARLGSNWQTRFARLVAVLFVLRMARPIKAARRGEAAAGAGSLCDVDRRDRPARGADEAVVRAGVKKSDKSERIKLG